jgi:hypothetical protein
MEEKELLINLASERIFQLYKLRPLYFNALGEQKELSVSYSELLDLLIGGNESLDKSVNPKNVTITSFVGSTQIQSSHYRRSLEDMFLLAKHYIPNASITEVAKASKSLSSNFCFDTGLRVYRHAGYYGNDSYSSSICRGHNLTEGGSFKGILSSLWWYDEDNLSDRFILDSKDYDDFIEIVKKAEECAKNHPNFVAVGRGYLNSESKQSL